MIVEKSIQREILSKAKNFKAFWKEKGPFKYALTSMDFPPVLLEQEEWIFSNDITILLKELMQFDKRKMKIVKAAFNPENKNILRPEKIIPWKINNFPEEWDGFDCDVFTPQGHLTLILMGKITASEESIDASKIESAFFQCLKSRIEQIGYLLLKPERGSKQAGIQNYLSDWEKDDKDAGL